MKPKFEELVRATVILIALGAVAAYAFLFRSEVALGALLTALGLGSSFLFRGRVLNTTPGSPTLTAIAPPKAGD
jgi:hypothetical protein